MKVQAQGFELELVAGGGRSLDRHQAWQTELLACYARYRAGGVPSARDTNCRTASGM